MEYMQSPRPELEWNGFNRERRRLSQAQWHQVLMTMLYTIYNDMYPKEPINHQAVVDYFDDDYINDLTSFCKRIKKLFTKCFKNKKEDRELLLRFS